MIFYKLNYISFFCKINFNFKNKIFVFFLSFFFIILLNKLYSAPPFKDVYDIGGDNKKVSGKAAKSSKIKLKKLPEYAVPKYGSVLTTGTVKVAVICIEFTDKIHNSSNDNNYYKNLIFSSTNDGSMYNYYKENSYNQLLLNSGSSQNPSNWVKSDNTMSFYGADMSNSYDSLNGPIYNLVIEAIEKSSATFDFGEFDQNNDGIVDHLIVIHAGNAQEKTGVANDIWSHRWEIYGGSGNGYNTHDKNSLGQDVYVKGYTMQAENSPMGIFAHEFGHDLGLPDLYDSETGESMIESWCLMDHGAWLGSPVGTNPSHLMPWCKIYLGWLNNYVKMQHLKESNVKLYDIEKIPPVNEKTIIKFELANDAKEYIILEYRKKDETGAIFDKYLPDSGVLAWHIDENIIFEKIVVDGVNDSRLNHNKVNTVNQAHKGVDLIEAEGADKTFLASNMFKSNSILSVPKTNKYNGEESGINVTFNDIYTDYIDLNVVFPSTITYKISGYVKNDSNTALDGIFIILSSSVASSTITDTSGYFEFSNLKADLSYTVTPYKANYIFNPVAKSTSVLSGNIDNWNFTGSCFIAPTYKISGYVMNNSSIAINSIKIVLSGYVSSETITNLSGYYEFSNLIVGAYYQVAPQKTDYNFSPVVKSTSVLSGSIDNWNFIVTNSLSPSITVSADILDFGEIVIGQLRVKSLFITDSNQTGLLNGTISGNKEWIVVEPIKFSNNSTAIKVTVNTSGLNKGEYTGMIKIVSNGGVNKNILVRVLPTCVITAPNPFVRGTGKTLTFYGTGLPNGTICIYNLSGELIKNLNEIYGENELKWNGILDDGTLIDSGIYFYTATNFKEPEGNKGYFTVKK